MIFLRNMSERRYLEMKIFLKLWHVSFFFFWGGTIFLPLYITYLRKQESINHFQFIILLLILLVLFLGLLLWPLSSVIIFWQSHKKRKQKTVRKILRSLLDLDPHYFSKAGFLPIVLIITAMGKDVFLAPENILKLAIPIGGCILLLIHSLFRPIILMLEESKDAM